MDEVSSDDSSINVVDTDTDTDTDTSDSSDFNDLNSSDLLGCEKNVTRKRGHRRDYHNELERKRRDNLKGCFSNLRDILPHYQRLKKKGVQLSNNASRVDILTNAANFIDRQTEKNAKLRKELEYLKSCMSQSSPEINNARRTGKNARLKKKMKSHKDPYTHRDSKVKVESESSDVILPEDVKVEPESPTSNVKVEPESPTRDVKVEPESPTRDVKVEPESPTRDVKVEPESPARDVKVEPESPAKDAELPSDSSMGEWSTVSESESSDSTISTDSDSSPSPRTRVRRVLLF